METTAIQKSYRRYARTYDYYFGPALHLGRKSVVDRMNCQPGEHILEVGVGTGLSLPLYPPGTRITGIDISMEMLSRAHYRKARDGLDQVLLCGMDAEQMAFDDDSFDRVVAMYVASVVHHPERLVDEMRRVCKPDGELFIVNHFHSANPLMGGIEKLISPLSRLLGWHPDFCLETFMHDTRLEVIEKTPANLFGYWTMLRARNNKAAINGRAVAAAAAGR
ncbi:MAG: class I SAM-dependent methyltransferase [Pseudomonadota bacterium]|nr:class I SAM-dependent methyltransferase [Pseudomonadota bacterium]